MKKLFLIDGTALIFRSFHAFASTPMTSKGVDVGMVYGFLLSLLSFLRKENPDYLAIAFDTGAPTFRHKMYDSYKANRPPLDPGIAVQLPILYEIVDLLNIPQIAMEGWEADDVMGTLAKRGSEAGLEVYHVTGDKDFFQLVNDKVFVYALPTKKARNGAIYDAEGVKEKFGVYPNRVIDVLALMGDSSDNVPGVPKVGPKTAVNLIDEYGDFDAVLKAAEGMKKSKVRENLIEFADQARLSRELVVIDTDVPVNLKADELNYGPINNAAIRQKLAEMDFLSILDQLDDLEPLEVDDVTDEHQYHTVANQNDLRTLIRTLGSAPLISFDTETTSLDPMQAELVGLSFAVEEGEAWYISVNHFAKMPAAYQIHNVPKLRPGTSPELAYILEKLHPILSDPTRPMTGQNLKYDMQVLACYDIPLRGVVFDTLIASFLLDPARQHNLDALAQIHLGLTKIPTTKLIGSGSKQISMLDVELPEISEYACEDADVALRLTKLFQPRIDQDNMTKIFRTQELPLIDVLLTMEHNGVALDFDLLKSMSVEYQAEIEVLQVEIYKIAGEEFNLNSTQQLAEILYNKLGLPSGRKTKSSYSTDITELERLAPVHELPAKLLRYRHLAKLKSTYIDALPLLVNPYTGRVHTTFSQTVAATGRLSSNDPNLQNIPIRSEEGGRIRKAFIAGEPGWKIISADYSQIELRIMAHLSGDEKLIKAFRDGNDIHTTTAAWMHDVQVEFITPDMRRQAKEVNFGVLYGMGGFGLAQRLGISRKRADAFIESYFTKFARVKEFINEIIAQTRKDGYITTMMGRKRPLPEINAKAVRVRQNAERVAINTPIQGSAADLMKLAMIEVWQMMQDEDFAARMLIQVHDELVFEAPPDEVDEFSKRVSEVMSGAMTLDVPLVVDVNHGDNWLDAH